MLSFSTGTNCPLNCEREGTDDAVHGREDVVGNRHRVCTYAGEVPHELLHLIKEVYIVQNRTVGSRYKSLTYSHFYACIVDKINPSFMEYYGDVYLQTDLSIMFVFNYVSLRHPYLDIAGVASCLDASAAEQLEDEELAHLTDVVASCRGRRPRPCSSTTAAVAPPRGAGCSSTSASCVLRASRAASADDSTTAGTVPSHSVITGPCRRASADRLRCGSGPIWCRLPTMGSHRGPGGSLVPHQLYFQLRCRRRRVTSGRMTRRMVVGSCS